MEFLSRSQPGYPKVRNVYVQEYFNYIHRVDYSIGVWARVLLFLSGAASSWNEASLTQHLKASEHVNQIGSLARELMRELMRNQFPYNP